MQNSSLNKRYRLPKLTKLRRDLQREVESGPDKLALKGTRWLLLKNLNYLDDKWLQTNKNSAQMALYE